MENVSNKKLIIGIIKYGTWLIGLGYLVQIALACFGIQSFIIASLLGISIVPSILLCVFSKFLGFCIWNRFPIYYTILANIVNCIDYYIGIPISSLWMLIVYVLLLFMLIGAIIKNRNNERKRIVTKDIDLSRR